MFSQYLNSILLIIAICTECRTNIEDNIAKTVLILQCGILCHSDVYIMQMKITIEDIITVAVKCWWSKCMMFYQPTCEEICFGLKEVDRQQLIFHLVHGTYKRIWLSLEDRLVQAKEMYLIPWMFLETEIVFLVKSTPTNISMDHRSFGHHWTAEVYTYKYQHGSQIIWAPLNSQNLYLQMKFNVLLVLVRHTSDYIYQSCKHICLYDHHS